MAGFVVRRLELSTGCTGGKERRPWMEDHCATTNTEMENRKVVCMVAEFQVHFSTPYDFNAENRLEFVLLGCIWQFCLGGIYEMASSRSQ
jgi:hypothetical protein